MRRTRLPKAGSKFRSRRVDGFRSKLELRVSSANPEAAYEAGRVPYTRKHYYTPDFTLPNGAWVECKGYLSPEDRSKLRHLQECYPGRVHLVFAVERTIPRMKVTNVEWATKHGIKCHVTKDGEIPAEWGEGSFDG